MCDARVLEFFISSTVSEDFNDKRILEVGSRYVNGSVRPYVLKISKPRCYIGVDIEDGLLVDIVVPVEKLVERFGEDSFDVVISTELLEHVLDWRTAFDNMKRVLKRGGCILLTTRSRDFPLHGHPDDFWRYEVDDMRKILSDFQITKIVSDELSHGTYARAIKPSAWVPNDLSKIELYSMNSAKQLVSKYQVITFRIDRKYFRLLRYLFHPLYSWIRDQRVDTKPDGN